MKKSISEQVAQVTEHYPADAKLVFDQVRSLVMSAADTVGGLDNVDETVKWGEPSYLAEGGSTVRMKWSDKQPDQFNLYFNCQSILIETFRELYKDEFTYDGNRAMSFQLADKMPEAAIEHCIATALQYHKLKKLPLLGN